MVRTASEEDKIFSYKKVPEMWLEILFHETATVHYLVSRGIGTRNLLHAPADRMHAFPTAITAAG